MTRDEGVWVYAVTTAGSFPGGITGIRGVAGEELNTVTEGGFTSVVGTVALDTFGEQALRRNLEDLDWLSETARRHDAVVAAICAGGTTVPMRLATVYYDEDRVRTMLRENAAELTDALEHITGRSEWGIRSYLDRRRADGDDTAEKERKTTGTAYLMERRARAAAQEETQSEAARLADEIFAELGNLAVAAVRQPPSASGLSPRRASEILNASYLVDNARVHEFTAAVESVDTRIDDVDTVITGPWPPYSFTAVGSSPR
ncbi:GvpL/GvpF family gas vesicle protein [Rhodococcus sp. OK519]|uniref:GvpL/GvpF family gas vesicle protein n=1 Tax=Rhodococcus sp. OK519 TaxID=2135729 RepID=UPI000D3A55EE